jgi:hypothetical protein
MKKLVLALALAAAASGSAFADTSVSAGLSRVSGAGHAIPALNINALTQSGNALFGLSAAAGSHDGETMRQVDASVGYLISSNGPLVFAPTAEIGYDKLGAFSAKHVAVGANAQLFVGPVSLFGGAKVGRTFGTSRGDAVTYVGADIGAGYKVGPGVVALSYDVAHLADNLTERRVSLGYSVVF